MLREYIGRHRPKHSHRHRQDSLTIISQILLILQHSEAPPLPRSSPPVRVLELLDVAELAGAIHLAPLLRVNVEEPHVITIVPATLGVTAIHVHHSVIEIHRFVIVALRWEVTDLKGGRHRSALDKCNDHLWMRT